MKITFEIDDELIPSLEQHVAQQIRVENDELTQGQRHVRVYPDVESFLEDVVHQAVHQVVLRNPPPSIRKQMEQAAALQKAMKESMRPRRVKG